MYNPRFESLFLQNVVQFPDKPALSINGQVLTYQELNHKANQMARCLIAQLQRIEGNHEIDSLSGRRVALIMPKCVEHFIAFLAIWKARGSIVLLRPPAFDEVNQQWQFWGFANMLLGRDNPNWKVDLIVGHSRYIRAFIQDLQVRTYYPDLDNTTKNYLADDLKLAPTPLENEAYTTFTSATTGKPKGAINCSTGLYSRISSHIKFLDLGHQKEKAIIAQDRLLYIDASIMEIILAWSIGARLEVVPDRMDDWEQYIHFFDSRKITHAIVVPAILNQIFKQKRQFKTLNYILTTGESMTDEVYQYFLKNGDIKKIVNGYGPCEMQIGAMLWEYKPGQKISIGTEMEGVKAYIVESHESGEVVLDANNKVNVVNSGQLMLTGAGVGLGYNNNEELTKQRFRFFDPNTHQLFYCSNKTVRANCYLTGDKVTFENGLYYIHGRYDRQLKINGRLLMPDEIESVIKELDFVDRVQVDVLRSHNTDTSGILVAGVVFKKEKENPFLEILEYLQKKLPAEKIPQRWKRFELKNLAAESTADSKWKQKPLFNQVTDDFSIILKDNNTNAKESNIENSDLLTKISAIFRKKLPTYQTAVYALDIHATFNQLGGDSITVMGLANELRAEFPHITFTASKLLQQSIRNIITDICSQEKMVKIFQLNKEGTQYHPASKTNPPIFFIHALLGDAYNDYDRFADFFNSHAIYGISVKTVAEIGDIDVYAKYYKIAIQKQYQELCKEKNVPYILVGWSSGGVIAHRVSEILRSEGHDVVLFMLDSTSGEFLRQMSPIIHKKYAARLAVLTGHFIARVMKKYGDDVSANFLNKVNTITLSPDSEYDKEIDIENAFLQLQMINDNFINYQDYEKNKELIHNAYSIALGVLRYKPTAQLRPYNEQMYDTQVGKLYWRLFYASKNKPEELGKDDPTLGWNIQEDQYTTLEDSHLGIMKKQEMLETPSQTSNHRAFEKLVTILQQDIKKVSDSWNNQVTDSSAPSASSSSSASVIDLRIDGSRAEIDNATLAVSVANISGTTPALGNVYSQSHANARVSLTLSNSSSVSIKNLTMAGSVINSNK